MSVPFKKDQINEVYFERVFNLGNYETCRIGLRATVGANQDPIEVVAALDKATVEMRKNQRR
jgi:proteasome assembly chaperone (PAC2) family protein